MIRRVPIAFADRMVEALLAGPWTYRPMVDRLMATVDVRATYAEWLVKQLRTQFPDGVAVRSVDALRDAVVARLRGQSDPFEAVLRTLIRAARTTKDADRAAALVRRRVGDARLARIVERIVASPDDADEESPWLGVRRAARERPRPLRFYWHAPAMQAVEPLRSDAGVPPLPTPGDLAAWLGLTTDRVDWLADRLRPEERPAAGAVHYHHRWKGRRLIEAPKRTLRSVQRRILDGILADVPPHPAAVAFRPGVSVVDGAARHVGQPMVVRFDLRDFFASVRRARVRAIFARLGYPDPVADLLANLTTHATPAAVFDAVAPRDAEAHRAHVERRRRFAERHLPQGAPSSPALANLSVYGLDCRLAALARTLGATYTRYADDLVLSGDFAPNPVVRLVDRIVRSEGFALNAAKTRVMGASQRQRVTGVVVNARPNVARADFDRLKAVLTNCARHGAASQNRDAHPAWQAHLEGRVAWVASVHPERGARLRALLAQIDWSA